MDDTLFLRTKRIKSREKLKLHDKVASRQHLNWFIKIRTVNQGTRSGSIESLGLAEASRCGFYLTGVETVFRWNSAGALAGCEGDPDSRFLRGMDPPN